ncbi:MAG: DUF2303 family protein [Burkholderiaceae bacterium]
MNQPTSTPPAGSDARLSKKLMFDTGAAMSKPVQNPDQHGAHYVVVPEGYKVQTLPQRESPKHPRSKVNLRDAKSFIQYVTDHADENTRIYATVDPAVFLAVIDDHKGLPDPQVAGWREFRAEFKVPASREWKLWNGSDRKQLTQLAFAEFLQDNLPDVIEPDGASLLEMSLNFEASSKGQFVATQRLQNGSHDLQWRADNDAGGTIKLPEQIALQIPVFENESPSLQHARLRYRVKEGVLTIWYELIRPHKTLEAAFQDAWKRIADGTSVPILLGTPE